MNQIPDPPYPTPGEPHDGSVGDPDEAFNPAVDQHLEPVAPTTPFERAIAAEDEAAVENPLLESLHALRQRIGERMAVLDQQMERDDREFAESARSGELGPQWQKTQARIDAGETTMRAVLKGEDDDPDAQEIHGTPLPSVEEVEEVADAQEAAMSKMAEEAELAPRGEGARLGEQTRTDDPDDHGGEGHR